MLSPIVVLFGLLGLGLGRYEMVQAQVVDAARAGSQAAAVAPDPNLATVSASAAVQPALAADARACPDPVVVTETAAFHPGGSVAVTVVCHVPVTELSVIGFPGSTTVTVTETAPIDPYRSIG